MQFHHFGYVTADPRVEPAAGTGVTRSPALPDAVDVLIVGAGSRGNHRGRAAVAMSMPYSTSRLFTSSPTLTWTSTRFPNSSSPVPGHSRSLTMKRCTPPSGQKPHRQRCLLLRQGETSSKLAESIETASSSSCIQITMSRGSSPSTNAISCRISSHSCSSNSNPRPFFYAHSSGVPFRLYRGVSERRFAS